MKSDKKFPSIYGNSKEIYLTYCIFMNVKTKIIICSCVIFHVSFHLRK